MESGERGRMAAALGAAALLLVLPFLLPQPSARGPEIKVAVIQGNVSQGPPTDITSRQLGILRRHERGTKSISSDSPDLVVWPESSVELDLPGRPTPWSGCGRRPVLPRHMSSQG